MSRASPSLAPHASPHASARLFAGIDCFVFDLDKTLYPADSDLWPKIDMRITQYIMGLSGADGFTARSLQKFYYRKEGTTLSGLMREERIDPHDFLRFVHNIDRASLKPDKPLRAAIEALEGRKYIFTNGSLYHAEQTLAVLGLTGLFEDIYDIADADFIPKPRIDTYARFIERFGVDPRAALFVEDISHNLVVPKQLGFRTLLVEPDEIVHDEGEAPLVSAAHIDAKTAHLSQWLVKQQASGGFR